MPLIVYWIDTRTRRGDRSLKWSLPFEDASEARSFAKRKIGDGLASLATVWAYDHEGTPGRLVKVYPESAHKIIDHWLEVSGHAVKGMPPTGKG